MLFPPGEYGRTVENGLLDHTILLSVPKAVASVRMSPERRMNGLLYDFSVSALPKDIFVKTKQSTATLTSTFVPTLPFRRFVVMVAGKPATNGLLLTNQQTGTLPPGGSVDVTFVFQATSVGRWTHELAVRNLGNKYDQAR